MAPDNLVLAKWLLPRGTPWRLEAADIGAAQKELALQSC